MSPYNWIEVIGVHNVIRTLIITLLFSAAPGLAADAAVEKELLAAWTAYEAAAESGDVDERISKAAAVLEIAQSGLSDDDERIPLLMSNYARSLLHARRTTEAQSILRDTLARIEQNNGKDSLQLVPVLANYADSLGKVSKPEKQLAQYERALTILAGVHGKNSSEYVAMAFRTGVNVRKRSMSSAGRKYLLDARDYYLSMGDSGTVDAGIAYYHLGYFGLSGSPKKSIQDLLKSLELLPESQSDTAKYRENAMRELVKLYEDNDQSELATPYCLALGRMLSAREDTKFLPLYRKAPRFPRGKLNSGLDGSVSLTFSVDEEGFAREIVVTEGPELVSSTTGAEKQPDFIPSRTFERAAVDAVKRFRYAPKFVDGEPVVVHGVNTRISFVGMD